MTGTSLVFVLANAHTGRPLTVAAHALIVFEASAAVLKVRLQEVIFVNTADLCSFSIKRGAPWIQIQH
jgi:hypothetical protein